MRANRILIASILVIAVAGLYAASPLMSAYRLRQAVVSGDTSTVERMVVWQSLRKSLKSAIAQNAQLLPIATSEARQASTSWWQRIRSALGYSMLDRFIERYITPKGLTELYRTRTNWHQTIGRSVKSEQVSPSLQTASLFPPSLLATWKRVKRAEFLSPFRFVLELEDRYRPTRIIISTFELASTGLHGFDWRLVTVDIREHTVSKAARLAHLNGF